MSIFKENNIPESSSAFSQSVYKPTLENYLADALVNLENTSRTAKGTVDVSASPDKALKMQEGLSSESAAETAINNFKNTLKDIYENKNRSFKDATELREFVESVATRVNQGIVKEGVLIRQGEDSPKYPYTRIADLENRMTKFYEEFKTRLENPNEDAKALAA